MHVYIFYYSPISVWDMFTLSLEGNHDTLTGYFHPKFPRLYGRSQPKGRGAGQTDGGQRYAHSARPSRREPGLPFDNKALSLGFGVRDTLLRYHIITVRCIWAPLPYFYIVYCYPEYNW